ncbi:NfeD family protein [Maribellus maritimus]|uniref:NfeD family protein n=1 Tax=Maribellus maritimus TaxID=2870838 RepID=UPI001EE9FB01|nr:NfeD family protein [Maribellus maritimus]MCG6187520.1 NfeD family protein [Maribellus maritimus]
MEFELWHIWLLIALISFIMEIFIPSFILFNFGIGALVGSLAAGLDLSMEWQIVLFSSGTLMSFFLVRPVMKKVAYKHSEDRKTNVDAMVGRQAKVTEEISNENNRGRVLLDGDNWQARSLNSDEIPAGTTVEIVQLNSIVLIVKKIN